MRSQSADSAAPSDRELRYLANIQYTIAAMDTSTLTVMQSHTRLLAATARVLTRCFTFPPLRAAHLVSALHNYRAAYACFGRQQVTRVIHRGYW